MAPKRPSPPARANLPSSERVAITYRFPIDLSVWVKQEAAKRGWSANEFIVTVLEDLRSWYGLPRPFVDQLEADREALRDDRREYVKRLLADRLGVLRDRATAAERGKAPRR